MIKKILKQHELETLATDLLKNDTHSFEFEWTDITADYLRDTPEYIPPEPTDSEPTQAKELTYQVYKNDEVTVFTHHTHKLEECENFTPVSFTVNQHSNRASYKPEADPRQLERNLKPTLTVEPTDHTAQTTPPLPWDGSYNPPPSNENTAVKSQPCSFVVATFAQVEPRSGDRSTTFGASEYPQLQYLAEQNKEKYTERESARVKSQVRHTTRAKDNRHKKLQRLANKGSLPKHLEAELKSYTL